jgi:hypothetical protein
MLSVDSTATEALSEAENSKGLSGAGSPDLASGRRRLTENRLNKSMQSLTRHLGCLRARCIQEDAKTFHPVRSVERPLLFHS